MADADAVDIGFAPQTHDDDEGVALEVNLCRYLYHYTMDDKVRTVDKL